MSRPNLFFFYTFRVKGAAPGTPNEASSIRFSFLQLLGPLGSTGEGAAEGERRPRGLEKLPGALLAITHFANVYNGNKGWKWPECFH